MLPARRYWARFVIHLALGFLAGLVGGELVQAAADMPGWGVFGASAGVVLGAILFMLRADT